MRSNTQIKEKMWQTIGMISPVTRKAKYFVTLGVSGKQWMASFVISMLLLPLFSTPTRAQYVVRVNSDVNKFEPVNEELWFWNSTIKTLNAKAEEWMTSRREVNVLHDEVEEETKKKEGNDDKKKKSDKDKKKGVKRKGKKGTGVVEKEESENKKTEDSVTTEAIITKESKKESKNKSDLSQEKLLEAKENLLKINKELKAKSTSTSTAMFVNQLPVDEHESVYSPENNLGSPFGQVEKDSSNQAAVGRIRHRAGIANFSFGVPLASLVGREIDAGIGMTYNSRTWN